MKHRLAAALSLGLLAWIPPANASDSTPPGTSSMSAAHEPKLEAKLVDADEKAKKKSATVSVEVHGVKLIDPATVKEKPAKGQGHLHYRIDDGPVIATTATKLSFHELTSGPHTFLVMLAANDHSPLGPSVTLNVTIP